MNLPRQVKYPHQDYSEVIWLCKKSKKQSKKAMLKAAMRKKIVAIIIKEKVGLVIFAAMKPLVPGNLLTAVFIAGGTGGMNPRGVMTNEHDIAHRRPGISAIRKRNSKNRRGSDSEYKQRG